MAKVVCSFCGKTQAQAKKLIAGPGVLICDECIELAREIVEEEGVEGPPEPDERVERRVVEISQGDDDEDVGRLWDAFKGRQDGHARSALFRHYLPFAESLASQVQGMWILGRGNVHVLGGGIAWLSEAIDEFEPDRGETFEAYAFPKIKAGILDVLRHNLGEVEAIEFLPELVEFFAILQRERRRL
jgi:hypothetical protein